MDKVDSMPGQMGSVIREMGILRKKLKEILDQKIITEEQFKLLPQLAEKYLQKIFS